MRNRKLSTLLELTINEFKNGTLSGKKHNGLCIAILALSKKGAISRKEFYAVDDYINNKAPKNHPYEADDVGGFVETKKKRDRSWKFYFRWKPLDVKPRESWVNRHIKKLKAKGE